MTRPADTPQGANAAFTQAMALVVEWPDARETAMRLYVELEAERDALRAHAEREVRQFNSGFDAAVAHLGPMPSNLRAGELSRELLLEPDEDTWGSGFAWGGYEKLARERDALREQVAKLREERDNLAELVNWAGGELVNDRNPRDVAKRLLESPERTAWQARIDAAVLFVEAVQCAGRLGCGGAANLKAYQESKGTPFFHHLGPGDGFGWSFAINTSREESAEVGPANGMSVKIPPVSVAFWWNGWLAGFVDAGGGAIAAGEVANEDALITALRAVSPGSGGAS